MADLKRESTAGRLEGKATIVTGGATGIGEAVAHKFAREGARVLVSGLPDDPVDKVVDEINRDYPGRAQGHAGDVSVPDQAQACVEAAVEAFGKLDVLVNNAGVFLAAAEVDQYPLEAFDQTVQANLRSAFLMTRAALPHLQESKGNIVYAGSEAGVIGLPYNAMYGGTKAFLHAFARGVAAEQASRGVRANCVCPGPVDTAWTRRKMGPFDFEIEKTMIVATPLGRRGTVEEVANVYAFIASDEASYVTGALWLVDGGITIGKGPVGLKADRDLSKQPEGEMGDELRHTHEGLENKVTKNLR